VPFDFSPFDAVLLDLDGTLYHEEHVLPGAAELVRRIQAEGRPYACLTNSTSNAARLRARLVRMGIDMPAGNIYTAAQAAADHVLASFPGGPPRVFNLATEGLHEILDGRVRWVSEIGQACDAVIAGAPANVFATNDRQRTALYLLRAGARLVGVCADRIYPSPRGIEFGAGPLTEMLGYAANVRPTYAGKPEAIFFEELCAKLGVSPGRCVLVGDNVESDIAGAKRMGMTSVLVLSGVTRAEDVPHIPERLRPDYVVVGVDAL
jgi:HAD superfamily hydrolase (TIGR01450 family)